MDKVNEVAEHYKQLHNKVQEAREEAEKANRILNELAKQLSEVEQEYGRVCRNYALSK